MQTKRSVGPRVLALSVVMSLVSALQPIFDPGQHAAFCRQAPAVTSARRVGSEIALGACLPLRTDQVAGRVKRQGIGGADAVRQYPEVRRGAVLADALLAVVLLPHRGRLRAGVVGVYYIGDLQRQRPVQ